MNVLHVVQCYAPAVGGAEAHSREICRHLARAGHTVTVATTNCLDFEYFWDPAARCLPAPAEESLDAVRVLRFPVRHAPFSRVSYPGLRRVMQLLSASRLFPESGLRLLSRLTPLVPSLWSWLGGARERFDVVGGMTICFESLSLPAQGYANRHRVPFVAFPLTHLGTGEPRRDRIGRFYTMRHQISLVRRSDAVVAQTESEKRFYAGVGVPPERIVIGGPGVDPDTLAGGNAARFRARHGVSEPIVFFVGALSRGKGVSELIEAMERLWGSGLEARLVLAGRLLPEMEGRIATLSADTRRRMLMLGRVDEQTKLDLLAAGDVFAMPSRTDSFGITFLEAWVYGKPVLGAAAGGVQDVIEHERDGLLVAPGDVSAIADGIARLLARPSLAREMGERGRAKVLREHTWARKARLVEDLYLELVSRGAGAAAASRSSVPA